MVEVLHVWWGAFKYKEKKTLKQFMNNLSMNEYG